MKSRREARNEKDMYQKMFNQTQKLESKGKRSKTAGEHEMPKVWKFKYIYYDDVNFFFNSFILFLFFFSNSIFLAVQAVGLLRIDPDSGGRRCNL